MSRSIETFAEMESVRQLFEYWETHPMEHGNPMRDAINYFGRYYASSDCLANDCGYDRDQWGRCNAMKRDDYLRKLIKGAIRNG